MVTYKHANLGDCETESKVIDVLGVQVSLWRRMPESVIKELCRVYKPTGNPQADGRVGDAERKSEEKRRQ